MKSFDDSEFTVMRTRVITTYDVNHNKNTKMVGKNCFAEQNSDYWS